VVQLLLACQGEQSLAELMEAVGLTHREQLLETYLIPALAVGYLEMTIPDKPKISHLKYRLTTSGQAFLNTLPTEQP
jgi:ATP-dependent DNA helicase RecG